MTDAGHGICVTILPAWDGVQVKVDPETILPGPPNDAQKVPAKDDQNVGSMGKMSVKGLRPRCPLEEGFAFICFHGPEAQRDPQPVQPCTGNFGDILFGLEDLVSQRSRSRTGNLDPR